MNTDTNSSRVTANPRRILAAVLLLLLSIMLFTACKNNAVATTAEVTTADKMTSEVTTAEVTTAEITIAEITIAETTTVETISDGTAVETTADVTTTVETTVVTMAQVTTVKDMPKPEIPVYTDGVSGGLLTATKVVIPALYNEGIACDINGYRTGKTIYLFIPARADISNILWCAASSSGKLTAGYYADFTNNTQDNSKKVKIGSTTYTVKAVQSDAPTLYVEIDESYGTIQAMRGDEDKETRAYGNMILECTDKDSESNGWKTVYSSSDKDEALPCSMYLKGRGNASWSADKQGYSLKLEGKLDLLGMSKSKKWVLIPNYGDETMLRNTVAFSLAESFGLRATPDSRFVELFLNGNYYGSFLLCEKVEIDDERLDIADLEESIEALAGEDADYGTQIEQSMSGGSSVKYWTKVPDPEDISGGYLIEMEMKKRYEDEASGFMTTRGVYFVIKSPEYCSYRQVNYIRTLVQNAEDAIYAEDGINPKTGKHFTSYIDLDSFVLKYWLEEVSANHDGAKTSQYFYKPADSESTLLFNGPAWDYDIAFGNYREEVDPQKWYIRERVWYSQLMQKNEFAQRAEELYNEVVSPALNKLINEDFKLLVAQTQDSAAMNNTRWKNLTSSYQLYTGSLLSFIKKRFTWMNSHL